MVSSSAIIHTMVTREAVIRTLHAALPDNHAYKKGRIRNSVKTMLQMLTLTLMLDVNANNSLIRRPLTETCIHVGKPYVGLSTWAYSYPVIKG